MLERNGITVNIHVAGSVIRERELAETVRTELLKVRRRSGTLGLA
jgi:hypothetical protein